MNVIIGTLGMVSASSVIHSINVITGSVCSLLGKIRVTKHVYEKEIQETLIKTDIGTTLLLLGALMKEIKTEKEPVLLALRNLQNIIADIDCELKEIYEKIQYNAELQFLTNWRSHDFKENIKNLLIKVEVLEKRRAFLFETVKLFLHE
jgi:multisubunit Na+/H+ antiporter MnhG subunit